MPSNRQLKRFFKNDTCSKPTKIPLILTPELRAAFASLSTIDSSQDSFTVAELNIILKALVGCKADNPKQHLVYEQLQLAIVQAAAKHLQENFSQPESKKSEKKDFLSLLAKKILFWSLIVLQFIPAVIGGFLGIKSMLQLIPGIPDPITYLASLVICGIESILYYGMMSSLFKRALGIPEGEDADIFVQNYSEQLTAVNQINTILMNPIHCADKVTIQEFSEYKKLAGLSVAKIKDIKNTLPDFKESTYKVAIRWGFSAVNQALTVAGVYYMVNALLLLVAAPLVGTPIGWGIIVVLILGQLAANFALRNDGMFYILNPKAQRHHNLKEDLEQFKDRSSDLKIILDKMRSVELADMPSQSEIMEADFNSYSSLWCPRTPAQSIVNPAPVTSWLCHSL